jgi:hypothetical protein
MQGWNLLAKGTMVTTFKNHQRDLTYFYCVGSDSVFCNDNNELKKASGLEHKPDEWHLFTDSLKPNLKAVLLYNKNIYSSNPHILFT